MVSLNLQQQHKSHNRRNLIQKRRRSEIPHRKGMSCLATGNCNTDNLTCISGQTICFDGRGTCENFTCICTPAYAQASDLIHITDCSHAIIPSKILYAISIFIWGVSLLLGIPIFALKLSMKEKVTNHRDVLLLFFQNLTGLLYVINGIFIVSAVPYGSHGIGINLVSSCIFFFQNSIMVACVILKPLVPGDTISFAAFNYSKRVRQQYVVAAQILLIACLVCAALPIGIYFAPQLRQPLVMAVYVSV